MLIILEPGLNSGLRGKKDGKTLYNLLFESMRCSFTKIFWRSVSVLIEWGGRLVACIKGIIHEGFDEMILWEDGRAKLRSACKFV